MEEKTTQLQFVVKRADGIANAVESITEQDWADLSEYFENHPRKMVPNAEFDEQQPESETNQREIPVMIDRWHIVHCIREYLTQAVKAARTARAMREAQQKIADDLAKAKDEREYTESESTDSIIDVDIEVKPNGGLIR